MPTLEKPVTFSNFEALKRELSTHPVHGARSFDLSEVKGTGGMVGDSFKRVTTPIFPKTGVKVLDTINWKVSDLMRLSRNSVVDFPKAAIQGGFYGSLGGSIVALLIAGITRKLNGGTFFFGALSVVAGGMMGAGLKVVHEGWSKLKELKSIIF